MIGKTLGHYRIIEKLGSGGMGVVYKAQDLHLDRFVALKVLPPEKVADPERKRRFTQEAKAASALNHPNIVHIYDITADQDVDFIVMEYVEGKTLEQMIGRRSMRLNDSLKYAVQVADALAKAHSAGIVHRDMKPANVMVSEDGTVKVLDFGLAKLTEHFQGDDLATTAATEAVTEKGAIVGTVAYMSPEQAEGRPVDPRSDIFSFGSVIYEMVTGRRAFQGDSKISTLAAILHQEPSPVSEVSGETPQELERIITRCLKKDPARRFQNMADLKVALEELKEESDSGNLLRRAGEATRGPRFSKRIVASALAVVVLIVIAVLFLMWNSIVNRSPSPPLQGTQKQITFIGNAREPALSPDGSLVAYSASGQLMLQDLSGGQSVVIDKEGGLIRPCWSPDGYQILGRKGNDLILIPRLGGAARIIVKGNFRLGMSCWSPDGTHVATTSSMPPFRSEFLLVDVSNGASTKTALTDLHALDLFDWARTSNLLLVRTLNFQNGGSVLWSVRPDGSQRRKVIEDKDIWSAHWSPAGDAVYYFHRTSDEMGEIVWISIDPKSGAARDKPAIVLSGLGGTDPAFTLSSDGNRLAYTRSQSHTNLWQVQLTGDERDRKLQTRQLTQSTLTNLSPSISPDNNWIAFTTSPGWGSRKSNIYKTLIDGGAPTQLTFLNVNCYGPAWSPDGTRVAFNSDESGSRKIWIVDIGGGRPRQLAKTQIGGVPGHGFELSWAPGHSILYRAPEGKIKLLDPDTEEEKMLVKDDSFYAEGGPIYSPDGMRVAVNARGGIWVVSVKDNTGSLVIKEKASLVGWSPNGNSVFAAIKDQMMAIPLNGGNAKPLFTLPTPNILCVSPDGRRFIYSVSEAMSDIWLLSNIDPARRR